MINPKSKKLIILIILSVIMILHPMHLLAQGAPATCPTQELAGTQAILSPSSPQQVYKFGVCALVEVTGSSPKEYLIPFKSQLEWDAFLAHLPPGVTKSACAEPKWSTGSWGACIEKTTGACGPKSGTQSRTADCSVLNCKNADGADISKNLAQSSSALLMCSGGGSGPAKSQDCDITCAPTCTPPPPNNAFNSNCPPGYTTTMCGTGGSYCGLSGTYDKDNLSNPAKAKFKMGLKPAGYGNCSDVSTGSCSIDLCENLRCSAPTAPTGFPSGHRLGIYVNATCTNSQTFTGTTIWGGAFGDSSQCASGVAYLQRHCSDNSQNYASCAYMPWQTGAPSGYPCDSVCQ